MRKNARKIFSRRAYAACWPTSCAPDGDISDGTFRQRAAWFRRRRDYVHRWPPDGGAGTLTSGQLFLLQLPARLSDCSCDAGCVDRDATHRSPGRLGANAGNHIGAAGRSGSETRRCSWTIFVGKVDFEHVLSAMTALRSSCAIFVSLRAGNGHGVGGLVWFGQVHDDRVDLCFLCAFRRQVWSMVST